MQNKFVYLWKEITKGKTKSIICIIYIPKHFTVSSRPFSNLTHPNHPAQLQFSPRDNYNLYPSIVDSERLYNLSVLSLRIKFIFIRPTVTDVVHDPYKFDFVQFYSFYWNWWWWVAVLVLTTIARCPYRRLLYTFNSCCCFCFNFTHPSPPTNQTISTRHTNNEPFRPTSPFQLKLNDCCSPGWPPLTPPEEIVLILNVALPGNHSTG